MIIHGINVTPNLITEGAQEKLSFDGKEYNGFYVSYNVVDRRIYGCDTTALVLGQMERFYILNGDHREAYSRLIGKGFNECLDYFMNNIKAANEYSEHINAN